MPRVMDGTRQEEWFDSLYSRNKLSEKTAAERRYSSRIARLQVGDVVDARMGAELVRCIVEQVMPQICLVVVVSGCFTMYFDKYRLTKK